nr:winged helix-turn-helix domain-containing protein [Streptomonospora nanhaiensis]
MEALLGPTRARVLLALGRSRCTGGLARLLGVAESTVSEHVRVLRASGLVHSVYTGRWRMHTLTPLGAGLAFPRSPR